MYLYFYVIIEILNNMVRIIKDVRRLDLFLLSYILVFLFDKLMRGCFFGVSYMDILFFIEE